MGVGQTVQFLDEALAHQILTYRKHISAAGQRCSTGKAQWYGGEGHRSWQGF